jgi:hypothetical protein
VGLEVSRAARQLCEVPPAQVTRAQRHLRSGMGDLPLIELAEVGCQRCCGGHNAGMVLVQPPVTDVRVMQHALLQSRQCAEQ